MNFSEIERDAQYLLNEYSTQFESVTGPPIPVDKIADFYLELNILYEVLDDRTSGSINLATGLVTINQHDSFGRQRFSLGHEVGHYRLHRKDFDFETPLLPIFTEESTIVCRKDDSSRRETEANVFSASLLMPRRCLEPIFLQESRKAQKANCPKRIAEQNLVKTLANIFKVSGIAMSYRLQNLDLFGNIEQEELFSTIRS